MNPDKEALDRVIAYAQKVHGVKIKFKNESRLMKVLGWVLFFNSEFMTRFVTVIGSTVYYPSREKFEENPGSAARVLCHELIHISDSKRFGETLFRVSYLFPQCLSVLALLTFVIGPWALMSLIFLLPLPAFFRTFWELRGYAMTDAVTHKLTGKFTDMGWLTGQFTTGSYYFMWPFLGSLKREIRKNRYLILHGNLHEEIPEADVILKVFFGNSE